MNKRGVSIMIGYVLLIAGIIVVSAIVYTWMRSYVPREAIECPDGVSLFIEEAVCEKISDIEYNISLSIKNNGRFGVDGYFIKATNDPDQTIAVVDISEDIKSGGSGQSGIVLFSGGILSPGERAIKSVYNLNFKTYLIEIIPIKYETIEGKNILSACSDAKIKEKIIC
jgi:hypothetical protein